MSYVGLSVGIHGIDFIDPAEVKDRVDKLLREHFLPMFDLDIEVDIDEFSGNFEQVG